MTFDSDGGGLECLEQESLDLIVQHKYESTTSTTQNVGEGALEESVGSFGPGNLGPTVQGVLVLAVGNSAARLHHHTTTDGVERIRDDSGNGGHSLSNQPGDDQWGVLGVRQHALGSVEESKVGGTVDDDTLDGDDESTVQTKSTVRFEDLDQTVAQSLEFTMTSLAGISSQTGTGKVKRVDEAQRSGTGSTTAGQVTTEVAPELLVLVDTAQEDLLVLVLEGKVQCLGGEVTNDIGKVTTPEGQEALFTGNAHETVDHTLVLVFFGDLFGHVLDLQQKLHTFDGRNCGL